MKIDIVSDPICPWCYIGYTRLLKALKQRPEFEVQIEWHPFMLNPDMPAEGMERNAYLEGKFGGKDGAFAAYRPIAQTAQVEGLDIAFDEIKRTPNTVDAHRLIYWASVEGQQTEAVNALFTAYFHDGRDISDLDCLADIADNIDMDAAVVRKLLGSDVDCAMVTDKHNAFGEMGITAVPTFIVAGQHAVPGAVETELWLRVMDEVSERG